MLTNAFDLQSQKGKLAKNLNNGGIAVSGALRMGSDTETSSLSPSHQISGYLDYQSLDPMIIGIRAYCRIDDQISDISRRLFDWFRCDSYKFSCGMRKSLRGKIRRISTQQHQLADDEHLTVLKDTLDDLAVDAQYEYVLVSLYSCQLAPLTITKLIDELIQYTNDYQTTRLRFLIEGSHEFFDQVFAFDGPVRSHFVNRIDTGVWSDSKA